MEVNKTKMDEIILTVCSDLSKRCVAYIKKLDCPPQYIADMLRDLSEAIMTPYPVIKGKSSYL